MNEYKTCKKCLTSLELTNFTYCATNKDRLRNECRECRSEYNRQRRLQKPEYERNRYLANQENFKKAARRRYWQDPESAKAKVRERRKSDPDRQRALDRKYYLKARPRKIAMAVARNRRYPEISTQNHNKRKALKLQNGVFVMREKELRKLRKMPCYHCGTQKDITLDHRIPLIRGGRHSIGNLMALCKYCNSSKKDKTYMEFRMMLRRRNALAA
jgi:5-methylcytosine-specific restriction endonuclease McrA